MQNQRTLIACIIIADNNDFYTKEDIVERVDGALGGSSSGLFVHRHSWTPTKPETDWSIVAKSSIHRCITTASPRLSIHLSPLPATWLPHPFGLKIQGSEFGREPLSLPLVYEIK